MNSDEIILDAQLKLGHYLGALSHDRARQPADARDHLEQAISARDGSSFFAHDDPPRKLRADARDLLTRCYTEAV